MCNGVAAPVSFESAECPEEAQDSKIGVDVIAEIEVNKGQLQEEAKRVFRKNNNNAAVFTKRTSELHLFMPAHNKESTNISN